MRDRFLPILSFGVNQLNCKETMREIFLSNISKLNKNKVVVHKCSSVFLSKPFGPQNQSDYYNIVASFSTYLPPEALLRLLKMLEKEAGRRGGRPWGPRRLDLDIIDYKQRIIGWSNKDFATGHGSLQFSFGAKNNICRAKRRLGDVILPHPLAHIRPFVLQPLAEISPHWRHPILHLTAVELLRLYCPPNTFCYDKYRLK